MTQTGKYDKPVSECHLKQNWVSRFSLSLQHRCLKLYSTREWQKFQWIFEQSNFTGSKKVVHRVEVGIHEIFVSESIFAGMSMWMSACKFPHSMKNLFDFSNLCSNTHSSTLTFLAFARKYFLRHCVSFCVLREPRIEFYLMAKTQENIFVFSFSTISTLCIWCFSIAFPLHLCKCFCTFPFFHNAVLVIV